MQLSLHYREPHDSKWTSSFWILGGFDPARTSSCLVSLTALCPQPAPCHGRSARLISDSGRTQKSMPTIHLQEPKTATSFLGGKVYTNPIQLQMDDRVGMLLNKDEGTFMDMGLAFDNIWSDRGSLAGSVDSR